MAPSGSGKLVNFFSKKKVFFESEFSVLLDIFLCGKKLKFVRVGHGSRVGLRMDIFSEGAEVIVHLFVGQVDRGLKDESSQGTAKPWNHRSRRGISWTDLKPDILEQIPDHMDRTEQRSYSHEGLCGIEDSYNEYWGSWQHRQVGQQIWRCQKLISRQLVSTR